MGAISSVNMWGYRFDCSLYQYAGIDDPRSPHHYRARPGRGRNDAAQTATGVRSRGNRACGPDPDRPRYPCTGYPRSGGSSTVVGSGRRPEQRVCVVARALHGRSIQARCRDDLVASCRFIWRGTQMLGTINPPDLESPLFPSFAGRASPLEYTACQTASPPVFHSCCDRGQCPVRHGGAYPDGVQCSMLEGLTQWF